MALTPEELLEKGLTAQRESKYVEFKRQFDQSTEDWCDLVKEDFPAHDVARAGGWVGPETLERVYQVPAEDRVSHVVHNPGEVRKVYGEHG